ncbi:MAG: 2,3-bisphosphoglycerate-independent phosphoglycerate mutase [Nitrososphaerota archaeon]|nr:2,3-bisphosphoglycerate-independent phosphoglycerate mutase [Aigarchaeota archaeon]MDW8076029.1 2,3-bisphosphoglycerate-independent phosphoglycerate mutase [Nitrososphaerota archaeon]
MVSKAIILVCDGMADRRCSTLGGLTPLQAVRPKSFDWIASRGECGLMDPISPGVPPGSDTAHLAIFGYDPYKHYTGRGAFEALGAGIELEPNDVAFRCNFATINDDGIVVDRRAGRISNEEAKALSESLSGIKLVRNPDVEVVFKHTVEHRGVLVLRGEGLSKFVSDIDPHKVGVKFLHSKPLMDSLEAKKTADALNEFVEISRKYLTEHDINKRRANCGQPLANVVLPRGAGTLPTVEKLPTKFGIRAAAIAGGALYKGVCKALGFDVLEVKGATGTVDTDLDAKMRAAINAIKTYDLVFIHVKATDVVSHDKNPKKKVEIISRISTAFSTIISEVDLEDVCITITSDHTTPSEVGEHTGDPVPVALYAPGARYGNVERFDEISCASGTLGRIRGVDLMPTIMNYLGKVPMYGE